jgi:hypothetical protein
MLLFSITVAGCTRTRPEEPTPSDFRLSEVRDLAKKGNVFSSSHLSWRSSDPEKSFRDALEKLGCRIVELKSQQWDASRAEIDGYRDTQLCSFSPRPDSWSFLLLHLHSGQGEPLAQEISRSESDPVIVFHEFDQAAWGFAVFHGGKVVARFWNHPEIVELNAKDCTTEPKTVAALFGVDPKTLTPYLRHNPEPGKAFDDDEFSLDNHWVRCDFMRRLGMQYGNPGEVGARHLYVFEKGVN